MLQLLAPWLAALGYGSWSAFSNWEFGLQVALLAFLVQGGFAFGSTWVLGRLAESSFRQLCLKDQRYPLLTAFSICSLFLWGTPLVLHLLAGTPNIFMAMLPGFIVGHCYLWVLLKTIASKLETSSQVM